MDAGRRRVVVLVTALLLSTGACSGRSEPRGLRTAPAPDNPSAAVQPVTGSPAPPPARPALPRPADIPNDSYAPEPVVEIGTIEIPAIGLSHTIFQGVTLNNIDRGPSHWTGTALPGQRGNTVFAAHRVTNSHPFRDIDQLKAGDEVVFTVNGDRSTYRVNGNLVVEPEETWIGTQSEAFTGTLYACHPPGSLAYRYVVRMELVDPNPA